MIQLNGLKKRSKKLYENVLEEIKIMRDLKELDCPFIIAMYGFNSSEIELQVVMEYCGHGSLQHFLQEIKDNHKQIDDDDIKKLILQILISLLPLRNMGIAHRDMKPDNLLINNGMLKLCDFGISKKFVDHLSTCGIGTPVFMAPESFQDEEAKGVQVDVWSVGIIAYYLFYGRFPFEGNPHMLPGIIIGGKYEFHAFRKIDSGLSDFINHCL